VKSPVRLALLAVLGLVLAFAVVELAPLAIDAVVGESRSTHAHTYPECLAKSYGGAPRPCFVIDDGVLIERRDDPAT
jgi:hypothetical protein